MLLFKKEDVDKVQEEFGALTKFFEERNVGPNIMKRVSLLVLMALAHDQSDTPEQTYKKITKYFTDVAAQIASWKTMIEDTVNALN